MRRNIPAFSADHGNSLTRKDFIKHLLQIAFWMGVVLIGFEFGLRYFVSGLKPVTNFDPVWGQHPVAESVIIWRKEGNGITHYISDNEIATPYQGGANIPVMGDSHTEAFQVNDNRSYVSVAETKLRGKGFTVDLRNIGASGGTLADYTYWASATQSKYNPSIVVIQISTEDFSGSGGGEAYTLSNFGNYFTNNADDTLAVVHESMSENLSLLRRIRGTSALLGYGQDRLKLFLNSYNKGRASSADDEMQSSSNSVPALDQKLTNYRAQLTALHTAYQGHSVIILVLPLSPVISEGQIILEDNDHALLIDEVKRFEDWQVVDPLSVFQALWLQDHKFPRGFTNTVPGSGHLNVDGHALVGQLLADKIEEVSR